MLAALTLVLAAVPQEPVDLSSRFVVPDGLRVTRFAESPQLYNPTAIDIDARNRIWVAEGVNYRKWNGRNPGREHPDGERIVILEDADGDGVAEVAKVFVEDPDLLVPLGIAVIGDSVYVSCSPSLIRYRDLDGDDRADEKTVVLTGFGGRDHDHGLHSVVAGPDGRLWFNAGNEGPHEVTDRDGFTLRTGRASDDGRTWVQGLVMRVDPDGGALTPIAHNFRNPYEVAIDAFGDLWQSDNDDDGNACCRTQWVMPGGDHGYTGDAGRRNWRRDLRGDQDVWRAHWHQDDPGVVPAGHRNGAGGPTGVCVYEEGLLPERFRGSVLNADAGRGLVYVHHPRADGSGYTFEVESLISAREGGDGRPARWFRPSDVAVGMDGAVYVADWYDPNVGGHGAGDREAYGRILRIAPAATSTLATASDDPLEALHAPAVHARQAAWRWARAGDPETVRSRLHAAWQRETDLIRRARLAWLLAAVDPEPIRKAVREADDPRLRIAVARALVAVGEDVLPIAAALASDPEASVRREAALLLRDVPFGEDGPILLALARAHQIGDRTGLEALGLAAEGAEEELFAALLAERGESPTAWGGAFAEVAWRLHPASAVPAFLARALARDLSEEDQLRAVAALAAVDDPRAAEAVLTVTEAAPTERVRSHAVAWLSRRVDGAWSDDRLRARLGAMSREGAELAFESGVLRRGALESFDIDVAGVERIWLVANDGGDGYGHDWATWGELELVGPDGATPLAGIPWVRATTGWGDVRKNQNCGGGPLRVNGRAFAHGIGTHATSEIVFRLPEGIRRLRGHVGPDEGGTEQSGSASSVAFEIWVERGADRTAFVADRQLVLDASQPIASRVEAARRLVEDAEGALFLVGLRRDGQMPDTVATAVAEPLRRHADLGVRVVASRAFAREGSAVLRFAPIEELAERAGDPVRGREVFFGPKAACAACHRYGDEGRDLGPDLSRIRDKLDARGLLANILDPSAAISFGYETWWIEKTDGTSLFGFLLADGPTLVLKDAAGATHVVPAADVAKRTAQPISLMPDTIALGLEEQELVDLVRFLLAPVR